MGIYQTGFHGRIRMWDRFFPRRWYFQQIWCILEVPKVRWFNSAYIWIGVWTIKNRFIQVGLYPQPPNNTTGNSKYPGENAILYSSDDMHYYLKAFNKFSVQDGDRILLNIERMGNSPDWIVSAINLTRGGFAYTFFYKGGDSFMIQNLSIIWEGYTGIQPTKKLNDGQVILRNVTIQNMKGDMTVIRASQSYNPEGVTYLGSKKFESPPDWLGRSIQGSKVTFYSSAKNPRI